MFTKQLLSTAEIFGTITTIKPPALNDLFSISGASEQPRHECYFEEGTNSGLPTLIIPCNDDDQAFFADVATYYPAWSPITSHVHVVLSTQIPDKSVLTKTRTKVKFNNRIEKSKLSIWAALAYTEAASLSAINNLSEQEPSYALCRRTLAFSLARSSALYPSLDISVVMEKWNMLRALTFVEPNKSLVDTVSFLAHILKSPRKISAEDQFCNILPVLRDIDFTQYQSDDSSISRYLIEFHPSVSNLATELSGDFDRRMEIFQQIVREVQANPHSELIDTVTIAFFANRILPSSMRYVKLLSRFLGAYQSILIWYGFFSALSERHASESTTVGIDRKLQRDITRNFDYRTTPEVDISINEFHTLTRIGLKPSALRPIQPRSVFVSLLPGIDVHIRLGEDLSESNSRDSESIRQLRTREKLLSNLFLEAHKILSSTVSEDSSLSKNSKVRYSRDRY